MARSATSAILLCSILLSSPGCKPPRPDPDTSTTGSQPDLIAQEKPKIDPIPRTPAADGPPGQSQTPTPRQREGTDIPPGREFTLRGHTDRVRGICFSANGRWLASGSHDRTVRLWDAVAGTAGPVLKGHEGGVTAVCFTPDSRRLVSTSYDKTIRVWDLATGKESLVIRGTTFGFISVTVSADGRRIAAVTVDGIGMVWDAVDGNPVATLGDRTGKLSYIAFDPHGLRVATAASEDNTVRLWDAGSGRAGLVLSGPQKHLTGLCFSPKGHALAASCWDETIRVWDLETGKERFVLKGPFLTPSVVCYDPAGTRLAAVGTHYAHFDRKFNSEVKVWDAATGRELRTLVASGEDITDLCFSPDGKRLAKANGDGVLQVWDASADRIPFPDSPGGPKPKSEEPSHQGKLLGTWVKELKSMNVKVRGEAVAAVGRMGPEAKEAAEDLGWVLTDTDQDVAMLAAITLPKLGTEGIRKLVFWFLSEDEKVSSRAAVGLVVAGKSAVPPLIRLLKSEKKATVGLASATLARIGADAVADLVDALSDPNTQVRGFAAITLGEIGKDARVAVPAIRPLLGDSHAGVRKAAADALKKLDP